MFNFLYVHFNNLFRIPVQLSSRPKIEYLQDPRGLPWAASQSVIFHDLKRSPLFWLLSLTMSSAYSWTLHKQNHKYVLVCVWLHLLSTMPIDLFMLLCVPALISDLRIIQFSILLWTEMSPFLLLQGLVAFMDWFNFATQFNELEMTGVISIRKLRWLIF